MFKEIVFAVLGTFALVEVLETLVYRYTILGKAIDFVKGFLAKGKAEVKAEVQKVEKKF